MNRAVRGQSVTAIRDPAGRVVASGRAIQTYNGALVSRRQFGAVRRGFGGYGWYYSRSWYRRYPGAWFATGVVASAWWRGAYWNAAAVFSHCEGEPISYVYGDSVTVENGQVYVGEESVATAEQYYAEANEIADAGKETRDVDWLPLGVFAVVTKDQERADRVLQLAVNREGVIRGNFHDTLTDSVSQVVGSVDRESQRVAFRPADKETPLVECGLYNLTQETLTVLIHFDKDRTEERTLIRLEEEKDNTPQQ